MQWESLSKKPGLQTQPGLQKSSQLGLGFWQDAGQAQISWWAFGGQLAKGETVFSSSLHSTASLGETSCLSSTLLIL